MELTYEQKAEFTWTDKAVVGGALLITGGSIDSFGNKIDADVFYEVGKHKVTGQVAILPTKRNQKHEFTNSIMKRNNQFN